METRIREIREAQGMSRRVLADRAHVGYDALAKWESNTNEIGLDNAAKVAKALGVRISDLIEDPPQHDYEFDRLARNYRALGPEGRAALVATSDALAERLPQAPEKASGGGSVHDSAPEGR